MAHQLWAYGFAAACVVTMSDRAPAQFISVPNPITGGTFNYVNFRATSLTFANSPVGPLTVNQLYFGQRAPVAMTNPYQSSYLTGGYGGATFADPRAVAQKKQELEKAQKQARRNLANGGARAAITDQWAYERGAGAALVTATPVMPKGVNATLIDADPTEIASGTALNELLGVVRPLDEKATRPADSALLPPDLVVRINFAGGPNSEGLNLLRSGVLHFPEGLRRDEFVDMNAGLIRDFAHLVDSASQNRVAVITAADRVLAAVHRARDNAAPAMREMAYPDAIQTAQFFNRLEAAARLLRDPSSAPAFVPNWTSLGLTVKELVRHMNRYNLSFGPAGPTDASAYEVLHRGMVGYYLALAQAAR